MLNPQSEIDMDVVAELQFASLRSLNESGSERSKIKSFLHDACSLLGASCAIYWTFDEENNTLDRHEFWAESHSAAEVFVNECTALKMVVAGDSFPVQPIKTGIPATMVFSGESKNVRNSSAAETGFSTAVAVQIRDRRKCVGIMEVFFEPGSSQAPDGLLNVAAFQLGILIQLMLSEIELRENEMLFRQMSSNIQALAATVKEAARKERAIIDQAVDVICSLEADLTIIKINPASVRLFGLAPVDLTGRSINEFLPDDAKSSTLQQFQRAATEAGGLTFENKIINNSGNSVDISWSVQWSDNESSFFCVARNITELKEVERLKQQFVAMISHDLRTPLMSVSAVLSAVTEGVYGSLSEKGIRRTREAQSSLSFVVQLVNSILELEQLGAGKMVLVTARIELGKIVQRSIENVLPLADSRSIPLIANIQHVLVIADEMRIVQVLINLLGNAIKYSPSGDPIHINIATGDDSFVEVRVTDNGRGVPHQHRRSIFDRFHQVEESDSTQRGGIGLGLAICKEIVELHGGAIGVDCALSQGSSFWFRLPIAE